MRPCSGAGGKCVLFNSYFFILVFLPTALALYFGLNRLGKEDMAKWALIGMSLWFYAYFHVPYLFLLVGSILFNFLCSRMLLRRKSGGKALLALGIAVNLGLLFYFKYFNFCMENVNLLFGTSMNLKRVLMPLGISFFTFQQISYLVDSYRLETGDYRISDYVLFVTFFPQLIAGPIVLHSELIPQLRDPARKKFSHEGMAAGIHLFAIGLFKKVMIADVLGRGADWGFAAPGMLTAPEVLIVSLLYTLQLYFDFSGYCDMACGIAKMFRFDLPLNFNSPYKAVSIQEFWQRWHMTLTGFLRRYLYIPLGGSRKGEPRTLVNILIVFCLSGIWHGAGWTFALWGLAHGVARILHRLFRGFWDRLPRFIGQAATFLFVDLAWIVFRAESLQDAAVLYGKLVGPWRWQISGQLMEQFDLLEFTYAEEHISFLGAFADRFPWIHLAVCAGVALFLALVPRNCHEKRFVPNAGNAVSSIVLLVWSVISLSGLSAFLYFNF